MKDDNKYTLHCLSHQIKHPIAQYVASGRLQCTPIKD